MGVCLGKDVEMLTVTEDKNSPGFGLGFSKVMFKRHKDWTVLKEFCERYNINQKDLNRIYAKYLNHDEVYIRQYRVRTVDTKNHFSTMPLALRELADVMLPYIYFKDEKGLPLPEPVVNMEEVTFTRFIVRSYHFLAQPLSDVIFDFFCVIRQNLRLKLRAKLFTFNLKQLVIVLMSELQQSSCKDYLLARVNLVNDTEISIAQVVKLGCKYPIMFYLLERFRKHMRRLVFGDRFWEGRSVIRSKLDSTALFTVIERPMESVMLNLELNVNNVHARGRRTGADHKNSHTPKKPKRAVITPTVPPAVGRITDPSEQAYTRTTARNIITDIYMAVATSSQFPLMPTQYDHEVTYIDQALLNKLKTVLGYKRARMMILESDLPFHGQAEPQEAMPPHAPQERGQHQLRHNFNRSRGGSGSGTGSRKGHGTSNSASSVTSGSEGGDDGDSDYGSAVSRGTGLGSPGRPTVIVETKKPTIHRTRGGVQRVRPKSTPKREVTPEPVRAGEYELPEGADFMTLPELPDLEERVYDPLVQKDFIYNSATGLRAWVRQYGQDGLLLKETWYNSAPPSLHQEQEEVDFQ